MRAIIIANGNLGDVQKLHTMLPSADLIICSDGGTRHLKSLGLSPHMIIGDFDSVDPDLLDTYRQEGVILNQHPREKDQTDTHLAVDTAARMGAKEIVLVGALGGRWDHAHANVLLLVYMANQGIAGTILHSHNQIVVSNHLLVLQGKPGDTVSLLPLDSNVHIELTEGLQYQVTDRTLPLDNPIGISNVFIENKAMVKIRTGWVMAVMAQDE